MECVTLFNYFVKLYLKHAGSVFVAVSKKDVGASESTVFSVLVKSTREEARSGNSVSVSSES